MVVPEAYRNCICSLGSADGYNTKSPEWLHINHAKEAYHASNKMDYVEQMAIWLQRHEAMWLWESYLIWVENQLLSMLRKREESMMDEEELEEDVIEHIDVTNINITWSDTQHDINITHNNLNTNYSLAKWPPHHNLTIEKLMKKFGTTIFLPAFLCHTGYYNNARLPWLFRHLQTNCYILTLQPISGRSHSDGQG